MIPPDALLDVAQKQCRLDLVLLFTGSNSKSFMKRALMKTECVAGLLALAVQTMMFIPASGLTRAQSPVPQMVQPSASSGAQRDPYADAFAGLTYTAQQKEAIVKIKQDMTFRKAAVLKDDKLTQDQKNAMLSGYTRMEYGLIFKQLSSAQQGQVSTRMHARRASEQSAQKTQTPTR